MSKRVVTSITCNSCKRKFKTEVYRTLWIEFPENRELIITDKINIVQCPHCNYSFRAACTLLAVDINRNYAVWYEPVHDDTIDSDILGFSGLLGKDNFYSKAPRISNWNYFKQVIARYEIGYFQANPIADQTIQEALYKLGDEIKKKRKSIWSRLFHN